MDRAISPDIMRKRQRKLYIILIFSIFSCIGLFILLARALQPGLSLTSVDVCVADTGRLDISLGATGVVVPYYEEIVTSPVTAKILTVYKKSGEHLNVGDTILRLDLSSANIDFEQEKSELAMRALKLDQYKATSQSQLSDMQMQMKIDEMKLRRMESMLANEIYLDSIGASTPDKIRQVSLEYEVSKLQFEQLKVKYQNYQQTAASDIRVLQLEYDIASKKLQLKTKTMGEAQVQSPRDATLSWVNDQIGSMVVQGGQLAILADVEHFKINAEISDSYASKLSVGNKTEIRIGDQKLTGIVGGIVPSVNNGKIQFVIFLDDNGNSRLRSGLRVDIYVLNSSKNNVVRIKNHSFYSGKGDYELWVISGNKAVKRKISLGEGSPDYIEVVEGIRPGEQVILTDMSRYKSKNKLKIR